MNAQSVKFIRNRMSLRTRLIAIAAVVLVGCALYASGGRTPEVGAQSTGMPGRILSGLGRGPSQGGIYEVNANGSNFVNLSSNTFDTQCGTENANRSDHPSMPRDGRLIAFMSNRDGTGFRIYVMNADGTGVRQLTTSAGATLGNGTIVGDLNPVISPDGSRIAFVSARNTPDFTQTQIFLVNTDGSGGLQQLTLPQTKGGNTGNVISVVWSPDGTRLAFKGTRLAADSSSSSPNFHHVVGLVNANGTGESVLAVIDSTGIYAAIDWSPDGRFIAIPHGREAQGAGPFRVILFDLQGGGSREILQEGTFPQSDGGVGDGSGAIRFSPDSQRLAYTTFSPVRLRVVDLNGVEQSVGSVPLAPSAALWWQAGAAIPVPDHLELIPNAIVSRPGGPSVQILPTLLDAAGNVIARAATGWTLNGCNGNSIHVSHDGLVTPGATTDTFTHQLCATNGGKQACATVFYNPTPNKIEEPEFFTSYQYFDFLNRTPDAPGLAFWKNEITSCGSNAACLDNKRTNVSQAFFLSAEFQQTGFLVFRFYKATFTDSAARPRGMPRMDEFLADTRTVGEGVIIGQAGAEQRLAQNQQDFARNWVQRGAFLAAFPSDMTAQAFVDKLFQQSEVTPPQAERNAAVAAFGAGGVEGRAAALRNVADSGSVFNKQYNPAFVLMQYIGYLRRNPNDAPDNNYAGFDFWLNKLNQFTLPGEDAKNEEVARRRALRAEMVKSFIIAGEYRGRFGQP